MNNSIPTNNINQSALDAMELIDSECKLEDIIKNQLKPLKRRKLHAGGSMHGTGVTSHSTVNLSIDNIIIPAKRRISSSPNTESNKNAANKSNTKQSKSIESVLEQSINTYTPLVYTNVPSNNTPNISYESYVALCDVRESTRTYLRRCKVYDDTATGGIPLQHKSPWNCIHNNICPVQLQQSIDTRLGCVKYRVVTKHAVKQGDVLCWYGGVLTEKYNVSEHDIQYNSIILRNDYLQAYFEYNNSADELCINAAAYKTIASYIRDPIYNHNEETNCTVDVVYDAKSTLFYVIYYATNSIDGNEEIFGMRHLGSWRNHNHRELYINARISHWQHQWCTRLESVLYRHKINIDNNIQNISLNTKVDRLTEDQRRIYWSNEHERINCDLYIDDTDALRVLTRQSDAYDHDNTQYISTSELGNTVTRETRDILSHKGVFYPDAIKINGKLYKFDRDRMKYLIKHGIDDKLIEIMELVELRSPPRYFCPPWYKSHTVIAKQRIPCGTLICTYAGVIDEDTVNAGSMSCYNLLADECRREFGNSYRAPDLVLDATSRGNIGKYINDCKFRADTSEDDDLFKNVEIVYVYDKIPHLLFVTTKDINKGDEIIQDYGYVV